MEIAIKVTQFILSLSLLIVLHELGHFIPAKLFKTKVEKFYLFFDYKFSLFKKKVGETVYGIGWIPLGGYVKIAGMIDESMDKEQLQQEPQPWEFRTKPAWQRLIIMLGGVFVNFVLGIFIYIMLMYSYGENYLPNASVKDGVFVQDSLAMSLGLQNGDKIISVDGEPVKKFFDITIAFINGNEFTIERNGERIKKELPVDFIAKLMDAGGKDAGPIVSPRYPFYAAEFTKESVNKNSGIQKRDLIVSVDSIPVRYFDEVRTVLMERKNQTVNVGVKRGDELLSFPLAVDNNGKFGLYPARLKLSEMSQLGYYELANVEYSFAEAIPAGWDRSKKTLTDLVKQIKKIVNPETGAYKGLGGFISIGSIFPAEWSGQAFWNITAFLSIMLGFMNLLPIPALDGGHVVFTLWEMITRRKPSDKFLEYAQIVGFVILLTLLVYANGNDIFRHLLN